MTQLFRVLIVEDHPFTAETYNKILQNIDGGVNACQFNVDLAHDADTALEKLNHYGLKVHRFWLGTKSPPMVIALL